MKKYLLLFIIPIIYNCEDGLTGHWHTRDLINNNSLINIDIVENNDCYLYFSLSKKPIKGKHFPEEKKIIFPAECGMYHFDYEYKKDKIYLKSYLGAEYIAEKQDEECDRFKDFKTLLNIDYLKIENKIALYTPKDAIENEGLNQYINIGFSDESNSIRIEYLNKLNSIDKIDSIIKYIENSVSDSEIPFINYILIPDKNLKASDLKLVISRYNKGYEKRIFTQILKIKPKKMNTFEYIKIHKIELNSDNKLSYIIN